MYKLTGLEPLYKSMVNQNIERNRFSIKIHREIFEIIYFIDSTPHSLAIGVRNKNLFFEVDIIKGFLLNPYLGDKYSAIYEILGLSSNSTESFSPQKFYDEVNKRIPAVAHKKNVPKPRDIAPYRNNVEELKKIYFCGWWDNTVRNENVRETNLEKTRKWLSEEAYYMCKKKNISSCWTADPSRELEFTLPLNSKI